MTEGELKELAWLAVEPKLYGVTREQFLAGLEGWTLRPHHSNGEFAAVVLTKGSEFHFLTTGVRWTLTRSDIRKYFEPLLAEHGEVRTKTPVDDHRQQRFNQILGFKETGRDEFFIEYRLTKLRSTACQS